MDKAGLFTLTSGLHSEVIPDVSEESFIREIVAAGTAFDYCGDDFSSYGSRDTELIYVRTGGTENAFKRAILSGISFKSSTTICPPWLNPARTKGRPSLNSSR